MDDRGREVGLTQALTKAELYDAFINHGEDLSVSIQNDVRARDCWTTSYPSSGYTVRTINPDGTWSTPSSSTYSCN